MADRPANDGELWTREQLILAFELYCRIPFQKTKATEPRVRELAKIVGRTPASIARKLGNFGAFDPILAARNISGLTHGSKLDKIVWEEFHKDWAGLVVRAHELRGELLPVAQSALELIQPQGPSDRVVSIKQRLHQTFFREAVLSSYNSRCCITGLPIPECLVAGHIIPWSVNIERRADPTNGICLSATFDRLFDAGLISIDKELHIQVSNRLCSLNDNAVNEFIVSRNGQKIIPPSRFFPDSDCLRWHREHVFQDV